MTQPQERKRLFLSVLSDVRDYFGNIGFGLSEFAKARRINSVQLTKESNKLGPGVWIIP